MAKKYIEALKKTKDAAQVASVAKDFEYSDWEMELDTAISQVSSLSSEVGGLKFLRLMILESLGKPSYPDLNDDYIARAIEIDLFDPDEKSWNYSSDEWKSLVKFIKKVDRVFEEYPGAASDLKKIGKRYRTDDIRFWEEQIGF